MPYIKRIVKAGNTVEVKKYFTSRFGKKDIDSRSAKASETSEKMKKVNEENATEKLRWLINGNFSAGDIHMVLTYDDDHLPDTEGAKESIRKYMRKLRKAYKEQGKELKYIKTAEYEGKRIHHHILVNKIDTQILDELWEEGHVYFRILDNSGEYSKLASYFVKETSKTYADGLISGKRWDASKNLKKPEITKVIVPADSWTKNPVPLKGYYIPSDSIETDVDSFGYAYQKYTMIKIQEKKGKKIGKHSGDNGTAMRRPGDKSDPDGDKDNLDNRCR